MPEASTSKRSSCCWLVLRGGSSWLLISAADAPGAAPRGSLPAPAPCCPAPARVRSISLATSVEVAAEVRISGLLLQAASVSASMAAAMGLIVVIVIRLPVIGFSAPVAVMADTALWAGPCRLLLPCRGESGEPGYHRDHHLPARLRR